MFCKNASLFYYFPKKTFKASKSIAPGIPVKAQVVSVIRLSGIEIPDIIPTRFTAQIAPNPCKAVIKKHFIGCFDLNENITVVNMIKANDSITIVLTDITKLLINLLIKVYKE